MEIMKKRNLIENWNCEWNLFCPLKVKWRFNRKIKNHWLIIFYSWTLSLKLSFSGKICDYESKDTSG